MSAGTCIPDLVAAGKLTGKRADEAMKAYRRHEGQLLEQMSPEAASVEASKRVVADMERAVAMKERRGVLQRQAQQRMAADVERLVAAGDSYGHAATKLLAPAEGMNVTNIDAQAKAILGRAHSMVDGILKKHSRNLLGEARDKAGLADLVRERFGENSGNAAARELSDAFGQAAEYLRDRHNRAGGEIGTRSDWGLPQSHDMMAVRQAGLENWKAEILPRLDLSRMIDSNTGRTFTPQALDDALRDAFGAIASDGWTRRTPGAGGPGRGSTATNRGKHRFFIFKSADDWMAYSEKFGTGNPFETMMGHLHGMASDIAVMERMGPNPDASLRWIKEKIEAQAATALEAGDPRGALDGAAGKVLTLDQLYDTVTGNLSSPVNVRWARRSAGVRSFLSSAMLGSASVTAVTDLGFQRTTRAFNGLPVTTGIRGYLKLLNPLDATDRKRAVRLGLQAEEAARSMRALARYVDDSATPEIAARMSDAVLRLSGLSAWTQAGRWDFGDSLLGHLADERGKAWGDLDAPLRDMLNRYGMDEGDWAAIQKAAPYREKGAEWVDPMALPEDVGDKLLSAINTETDYAVPTATARARATLSFGQRPGTLGGEVLKNVALFKSFGVSMVLTHGARAMAQQGAANKLKYAASLFVTTTLLGALALQAKEVAKGRDPMDMADGSFWQRAALMGGGFGIFGDFIDGLDRGDQFGGGIEKVLAGPVVSFISDAATTAKHAAQAAVPGGDDPNIGRDTVKMLQRYMPGGSLWYARLAFEREVTDQLQQQIDPDYAKSWQRLEDARADELGQGFWWRAGETSPDRAPQMSQRPPEN